MLKPMEPTVQTSHSSHRKRDSTNSEPLLASPAATRTPEPIKTLLVVDDDPMVRDLEIQILRLQGYTVLEAGSAAAAMRVAGSTTAIDLLITDFAMAEINGLELTRRFRAMHPSTPVLMVSGSLPPLRERTETDLDRVELLVKPFLFNQLIEKVCKLLDASVPAPGRAPSRSD